MKFSDETIEVLKSFSAINPGVIFKPGNTIRTMSPQKTVMATVEVTEDFEKSAAVFDLTKFLASVSLFSDPDVSFTDKKFVISGGKSKLDYTYAAENMVVAPPPNDLGEISDATAKVNIRWEDLQSVIRAASVLQLTEIAFTSDGSGEVVMSAIDSANPTADRYDVVVSDDAGTDAFKLMVKVENLKLLPNNYTVSLSAQGIAHFKSEKAQYWVAISA